MNDALTRYLQDKHKSPDAYARIVRDHIDLVYAAARRQLADPTLAEDVTQAVFLLFTRKAATINPRASLAGWLIKATHYACRDARRIAARREFHERQAMKFRPEVAPQTEPKTGGGWEEYAPFLDESLAYLSSPDRDALTLRFLQGLPLRDVGLAQRISEEAARKRVQRALDRLRKILSRRTTVPAVAVLATTLAANSAHAAPAALTSTILSAAPATASVTLIASAAQKSLWLLKAKLALASTAAAIVAVTTIAATTTLLYKAATPKPVAPAPQFVAAPAPAQPAPAANPDENESTLPGQIQCARWDALLDASELPNLQKIAKPLQTPGKIYNAYSATGVDLRRAIRNSIDAGTFQSASTALSFADLLFNRQDYRFNFNLSFYTDTNTPNGIMINGSAQTNAEGMTRTPDNHAHVTINHPALNVSIAKLSRNTQWINQPGQSIAYDGDLAPGQAVVFIGQLPTVAGRDFIHLIVYETFQADPEQMSIIDRQRNAQWWCDNGPSRLRQWANISRVWNTQAAHPSGEVAPPFQITLEDGKIVRLEALCRPAQWPFCWWDARGNPVSENNTMLPVDGEPPDVLWGYVTVASTNPQELRRSQGQLDAPNASTLPAPLTDTFSGQLESESAADFGIAVGPWKQIGVLEMDIPQTINGVTYTIRKPNAFGDDRFLVHFLRQGVLENQDQLVAVDAHGKIADFSQLEEAIAQGHNTNPQRLDRQPNFDGIPLANITEWRLMQRKRQWITFTHFATNPKNSPPAQATRADAVAAEQQQKIAQERAKQEAVERKRQEWQAIPATRTTDRGLARMLINAIHAHDESAIAALLTSNQENVRPQIPVMAHYLVAQDTLRSTAVARFGNQPLMAALKGMPEQQVLADIETELFDAEWHKNPDGDSQVEVFIFHKQPDHTFICQINFPPSAGDIAGQLHFITGIIDRLIHLLQSNPHLTLPEFKTAFENEFNPPATHPAK